MRYNPLAYIRSEKDILKLVNALILNTKGEGEKSSEDFWVKAERLYYSALIGYIWYEAEPEERNFITLPRVVFHSLRHSSTTYKLKLNHGDLKATQGDTGHAEIDMITSVYAHILDEDRKINAQKFESAFYANPNLRAVRPPEEPKEPAPATLDLEALVEQLRQSPELANTLAALLSAAPGGR